MIQNDAPPAASGSGSPRVAARFVLRMLALCCFAAVGRQPFPATMTALLALSAAFSLVVAIFRRERLSTERLTHWDEAALYALLSRAIVLASAALAIG